MEGGEDFQGLEFEDDDGFLELGSEVDEEEFVDDEDHDEEEDEDEEDEDEEEALEGEGRQVGFSQQDWREAIEVDLGEQVSEMIIGRQRLDDRERQAIWCSDSREGLNKQERQRLSASIFDYGSRSAGFQVGEETVMGHTLENLPDQQSPSSETCAADTSQHSTEEEGTIRDAISKRTRAHYSLADMSLDQLETFLQESDEEDYFQNVDDEEEYRKFLAAVQEKIDMQEDENKQVSYLLPLLLFQACTIVKNFI